MKITHGNGKGYQLIEHNRGIMILQPEGAWGVIFRYCPMWGTILLTSPIWTKDYTVAIIVLCVSFSIGLLFSCRQANPDFSTTKAYCGFGATMMFRTENAIILIPEDRRDTKIYISNKKSMVGLPVWDSESGEDRDKVLEYLQKYIKCMGAIVEPNT